MKTYSAFGLLVALLVSTARAEDKLDRITGDFEAFVVARNLKAPDGLAIHPLTHELYFSEEGAGRVSLLRNGTVVPVIEGKINVIDDIPSWAIGPGRDSQSWLRNNLTSPEGIAFSKDGHLFVVEDVPGGRVLEFIPDAAGKFASAHVIPVPLTSVSYAWEDVKIASDGRLFLAGSELEDEKRLPTIVSGGVFVRDNASDWWIVDCGPLAGFSAVALSRDEDILVVGEEALGGVTCWDAVRQCAMADVSKAVKNVEGLAVMPDGAIVVAQESKPSDAKSSDPVPRSDANSGRLLRIDPTTGDATTLADGFSTIESVIVNPDTHSLYVTEDGTGQLIELRPTKKFADNEYLLRRTVQVAEAKQGLAPRKAPPFIKDFFQRVGVGIRDQTTADASGMPRRGAQGASKDLTLEELGANIPMIAGKVKIDPKQSSNEADPIVEIQFIQMFPGVALYSESFASPGLSLYAAKHRSGRIERTQPLMGLVADHFVGGRKERHYNNAFLCLPLVSCSAAQDQDGVNMALAILNLDTAPDLYLSLKVGKKNSGIMMTDGEEGTLVSTEADILDTAIDGTEVVNVFMTGVMPRKLDSSHWLKIGNQQYWTLVLPEGKMWISHWINLRMPQLVAMLNSPVGVDEHIALEPKPSSGKEASTSETPAPTASATDENEANKHEASLPRDLQPTAQSQDGEGEQVITPTAGTPSTDDPMAGDFNLSLTNLVLSKVLAAWGNQNF